MHILNKITVRPQLPKSISRLQELSCNLWWSWNTEYLKLIKKIDQDLWEEVDKNPVKFLKRVSQEKLENVANDEKFVKEYSKIVKNFDDYMKSKDTWFNKQYPNNKNDSIAYFSAEYGLDQTIPIYSGGLGILSGDHLKSASDLGIPLTGVGLLYKNGYFHQKINVKGIQQNEYINIDLANLPIYPVKDENDNDLIINVKFLKRTVYLKAWQINVGRIKLYLLDSDIEQNIPSDREITLKLYGGDQEMRIKQEIVLGMAGVNLLKILGLEPTVYHMNEGHSAFLTIELMKNIIKEKKVSFNVARDITSAKTVFTTHTPVPAGNDIFPIELVEKYFKNYWTKLGIDREEFLKLGMENCDELQQVFNMGILALKIAGKKNGVSKLHGAVSRELFADVWKNIEPNESPITYVTNGVHTCSWLAPNIKSLYNKYLTTPTNLYWQEKIHVEDTWKRIKNIPNDELWYEHLQRKERMIEIVKSNVTERLRRDNVSYDVIKEITGDLKSTDLIIGFARRFATYKRATLIFNDMERITQILNDPKRPVKLVFAGKAHPSDKEGQELIKFIQDISLKPQFKGKIFLLENYNIAMSRYLISGVDIWLNTPRRPMEASGTSGQKAAINGVINFSVLDGWWAEGYNQKNGWSIGSNKKYLTYQEQDNADSLSIYKTLENKIIPMYFDKSKSNTPDVWVELMKNSIISTGAKYSTSRMVIDYMENLYMPLIELTNNYYSDLERAVEYTTWKESIYSNWKNIVIEQDDNLKDIQIDAGDSLDVSCKVTIPNINIKDIKVQAYCCKLTDKGEKEDVIIVPMKLIDVEEEYNRYLFTAKINISTGGEYGYTFRVMPNNDMLLDSENLDLIKWL